jgi:electron transfer flavoprotein beta subunit
LDIIVCIKQVPAPESNVRVNPDTGTLIREGADCILNPFDAYAMEEALRIREGHGGKISVLTMGPIQAEKILKEALAMGCDEGYLISDPAFAGSDTLATSYTLSKAIRKMGSFDIVLCGKQAIDGETAQVGPGLARWLGITQITYVSKICELSSEYIVAERLLEGGTQTVKSSLPVLVTVVKDINRPRLPGLLGIKRANKAEIPVWGPGDIGVDLTMVGLEGSPTRVTGMKSPPIRSGGEVIRGDDDGAISILAKRILSMI